MESEQIILKGLIKVEKEIHAYLKEEIVSEYWLKRLFVQIEKLFYFNNHYLDEQINFIINKARKELDVLESNDISTIAIRLKEAISQADPNKFKKGIFIVNQKDLAIFLYEAKYIKSLNTETAWRFIENNKLLEKCTVCKIMVNPHYRYILDRNKLYEELDSLQELRISRIGFVYIMHDSKQTGLYKVGKVDKISSIDERINYANNIISYYLNKKVEFNLVFCYRVNNSLIAERTLQSHFHSKLSEIGNLNEFFYLNSEDIVDAFNLLQKINLARIEI